MANVSRVNGFRPVNSLGQTYNARITTYFIPSTDATAVFVGDAVKLAGSADTQGFFSTVTKAAVGDAICGVVVGFAFNPTNLNIDGLYRVASTNRYVLIADDPSQLFEVQTSNGTAANTDVGLNANFADAGGSTTTSQSGETIDMGTKATTATLTFKIRNFTPRVDNDDTAASAKLIVQVNNHQFQSGTGSAGV